MKRINNTPTFTKSEINRIMKLYDKGNGLGSIAKTFAVSIPTIRRILTENSVNIRGRGRPVVV